MAADRIVLPLSSCAAAENRNMQVEDHSRRWAKVIQSDDTA